MLSAVNFPDWDANLFTYLNGLHVDWLDPIMVLITSVPVWIPLYVVVSYFVIRKYKWDGVFCMLAIILCTVIADQMSSVIKKMIERPRPCNALPIVHILENCGGGYSFTSNHASNVFGYAMLTSLLFKKKSYSLWIFFWAALVSYSRIYVGKHYPLDIMGGAIFGMYVGGGCYLLLQFFFSLRRCLRLGKLISISFFKNPLAT